MEKYNPNLKGGKSLASRWGNKPYDAKKTFYQNRGKVHLLRTQKDEPIELADEAYCGHKAEDCNHVTTDVKTCTCQKCLMALTGTWHKARGKRESKD